MSSQISLIASIIVLIIFIGFSVFQFLLALGKPYGHMAYGGRQDSILPTKYRIMSVFAISFFFIASILVLAKVEIIKPLFSPDIANLSIWLFAIYLGINTIANISSKNESERKIMTPLSFSACLCLIVLALGL